MPIVLTAKTTAGELLGRCCASCYDASPETECRCICRGENHSKGRLVAMAGARALAETFGSAKVHPEADQLTIRGAT